MRDAAITSLKLLACIGLTVVVALLGRTGP
jgi:hypothetical protein